MKLKNHITFGLVLVLASSFAFAQTTGGGFFKKKAAPVAEVPVVAPVVPEPLPVAPESPKGPPAAPMPSPLATPSTKTVKAAPVAPVKSDKAAVQETAVKKRVPPPRKRAREEAQLGAAAIVPGAHAVSTPIPASIPQAVPGIVIVSPTTACRGLSWIEKPICEAYQCLKSESRDHPECVASRAKSAEYNNAQPRN